jgi:site-specific DNA-methyltransferase (adenine-specific)
MKGYKLKKRNSRIKIYCEDCLTVLKRLPDKSIPLIVTSPPYNIGLKYGKHEDSMSDKDYVAWLGKIFQQVARVLTLEGHLFLNLGTKSSNVLLPYKVATAVEQFLVLQNHIIWIKSVYVAGRSYGHFKPINSDRYLNHLHENIFHFTKHGNTKVDRLSVGVPFEHKANIERFKHGQDKRCRGNAWYIPYDTKNSKEQTDNHPGTFPEQLVRMCYKLAGKPQLIMDIFAGRGTTGLAAISMKVPKVILIDYDKDYCKIMRTRIGQVVNTLYG